MRFIALAAFALFGSGAAHAADFCVATGAAFANAMNQAAASVEADTIRLSGTAITLTQEVDVSIRGDLAIRGGYSAGCPLLNPTSTTTTINASPDTALRLGLRFDDLTLSRLRLAGFNLVAIGDNGYTSDVVTGDILVQRVQVADGFSGMSIIANFHNLRVENSLFTGATSTGGNIYSGSGLSVRQDISSVADRTVEIVNNTSVGNRFGYTIDAAPAGLVIRVDNSIAYDNRSSDLVLRGATRVAYSMWSTQDFATTGSLAAGSIANLSSNPQLDASFKPIEPTSPAINSGDNTPAGGLPSTDYDAGARRIGTRVDRGAYESAVNDASVFTVTNTNNSGAGSLRQAILDANTSPDDKRIEFDIAGGCPRLITVTSALPPITAPVTISGYSQPGSERNASVQAFDGTICIALSGNDAVATGLDFQPGDAESMTVEGIAFYGFTSEGVKVSGAGSAVVRGNTFGTGASLLLANPGFDDAAIRVIEAPRTVIGGYDDADRNVISRAAGAGVRLQESIGQRIVRNNLIGFGIGGNTAIGNGVGISISGGYVEDINRNRIGNSGTHGILVEPGVAGERLRILENTIGVAVNGAAAGNGSNGIRISDGVRHAVVSNVIRNNGTDGLVVLSAARRVSIFRNAISDNALQGIDLSPNGVNPINLDVGATGANDDLNIPTLTEAGGNDNAGSVSGVMQSRNGTYRIQFYRTAACDADGYGEAGEYIGEDAIVTITNATATTNGTANFLGPIIGSQLTGSFITAIATDDLDNSSEISACIPYGAGGPLVFADGFE